MLRQPLLALIVSAASLIDSTAHAQSPADVLIRHATIVDVEHARLITDQAVATSGDRILAVGPDGVIAQAWKTSKTLDAGQRFLIPGLWDMHVHFGGGVDLIEENKALLPLYVAHGITTIRDCSGDLPEQVLAWRREIASGALFGPTLLSSGPKIEGIKPIWKGTLETGSQAEVDAAIAKLKALHVDFVKITDSTLKPELFLYAVRQARAAGLRTSGHIPMGITVRQAVDAGFLNSFNYPGIGLHDELSLFVANGLTPARALSSATRAGPGWFGTLDRYGAIGKDRASDMVLLDRNPLKDIEATRTIRAVILRGTVHDRAALDAMLSRARARVAAWNAQAKDSN